MTVILWIVFSVLIFLGYHKVFDVTYFSGKALGSEIIVCLMFGALLAKMLGKIIGVAFPIIILIVVILYFKSIKKQ